MTANRLADKLIKNSIAIIDKIAKKTKQNKTAIINNLNLLTILLI